MLHPFEKAREFIQRNCSSNEVGGTDVTTCDGLERLTNKVRRVVEGGSDCDFRIVEKGGIDLEGAARRATAEQVYGSPAAHHLESALPGARRTDGLDCGIGAVPTFRELANCPDGIAHP